MFPQTTVRITGGEEAFMRGGALILVTGSRYDPSTGWSTDAPLLHMLVVVPGHERGGASWGGGPDHRWAMALRFPLATGDTVFTDSLFLLDGHRVQTVDSLFDLRRGNLLVVYLRPGTDSVYQIAAHLREHLDTPARLDVFQRAMPDDSSIQSLRAPGTMPPEPIKQHNKRLLLAGAYVFKELEVVRLPAPVRRLSDLLASRRGARSRNARRYTAPEGY